MSEKSSNLVKDTLVYGLTSIVGRFLNYLLVPIYTYNMTKGDYGIVVNLYGWIALFLIILTFGLETGFFRFASRSDKPSEVFSTSFLMVIAFSSLFVISSTLFLTPLAGLLNYPNHSDLVLYLILFVAMDAISSIPFAMLRFKNRPIRFATIKMVNIVLTIVVTLFFFWVCPLLAKNGIHIFDSIFNPKRLVQYIFITNLVASFITLAMLAPSIIREKLVFKLNIASQLLRYSFPIFIVGMVGIINQYGDRIMFPYLFSNKQIASEQLGIYGACYKIGTLMILFTQAFRYAYEPFFFKKSNQADAKNSYADVMKHFIWFGLFIFLGVMFYIDILKYFIPQSYRVGLAVVPIILMANLFLGIYFNLSVWYKILDKTAVGAYLAIAGSVITLLVNIIFVPRFGYMASAWANFACFGSMMVASFLLEHKHYRIPYNFGAIGLYTALAMVFAGFGYISHLFATEWVYYTIVTLLISGYLYFYIRKERIIQTIFKTV